MPSAARLMRAACDHANQVEVKRRLPDNGIRYLRCPDCGMIWGERTTDEASQQPDAMDSSHP